MPHFGAGSGLRSPLDSDDLTNQHKKVRVTNQSTFGLQAQIQKLSSQIAQLRRRVITPPQSQNDDEFAPFKIFQVGSFTYQICGGIIACRPRYSIPGCQYDNAGFTSCLPFDIGNFYQTVLANGGPFNGLPPATSQVTLANTGDSDIPPFASIELQQDVDDEGFISASFWLDVQDLPASSGSFSVNLKGRMWARVSGQGRTDQAFPAAAPNIFPLGVIVGTPDNLDIIQIQYGNILPEYAVFSADYGVKSIGQNLGLWSELTTKWSSLGISSMNFYEGDIVVDDSIAVTQALNTPAGNFSFYKIYTYINGFGNENAAPHTAPTKWKYTGVFL